MNKINTQSRRFKYGSAATLLTVVVIVIAILLNVVSGMLVERYNLRFDMTDTKLYELSDITIETVGAITQPITINIFNNKDDFFSVLRECVIRIAMLNDNITVNYIDPYTNPSLVEQYTKAGYAVTMNSMIIEGPKREKFMEVLTFFNINDQTGEILGIRAEQELVTAFSYVTREDLPVVAFSDGHNEPLDPTLMKLFETNSYVVTQAALAVQDIQEDVEIFVIESPKRDFLPLEIEKLDAFMANGGRIIAFTTPMGEPLSNLEEFYAEWGIGLLNEIVMEPELNIGGNPLYLHGIYGPHVINNYFANNRYFPVIPACRALQQLEALGGVTVGTVLTSSPNSFGRAPDSQSTATVQEEADISGPFSLAIASSKRVNTAQGEKEAKIFVAGSAAMVAGDVLDMASFANADFIIQVINWCTDSDKNINIPAKKMTPDPLNIMTYQTTIFALIFIVLIPLTVLIYGIVVFFRRRHL